MLEVNKMAACGLDNQDSFPTGTEIFGIIWCQIPFMALTIEVNVCRTFQNLASYIPILIDGTSLTSYDNFCRGHPIVL
jgi:hypothetical protein